MALALAAVWQAFSRGRCCELMIARHDGHVGLYCRTADRVTRLVQQQLLAASPHLRIEPLADDALARTRNDRCYWVRLPITKGSAALALHADLVDREERQFIDPLAAVFMAVAADQGERLEPFVSIVARRAGRIHTFAARQFPGRAQASHRTEPHWLVDVRLAVQAPRRRRIAAIAKLRELAGAFAPCFSAGMNWHFRFVRRDPLPRRQALFRSTLLTSAELALLWHPPTESVRTPQLARNESRELEPPPRDRLPRPSSHPAVAVVGRTAFRDRCERFGLLPEDRLRGLYLIGASGTGKTTLLANLIANDMAAGHPVVCVDPHGDLSEQLLALVPSPRTNDVIYFDPADATNSVAFNPLAHDHAAERPLVASAFIESFKRLYADSWGPRLEHVLRTSLLTLLEMPGATLIDLHRLLVDEPYRKLVVGRVTDEIVRSFWQNEWDQWKPQFRSEVIAPVLNKLSAFTTNPILRRVLDRPDAKLRLREVLDRGKILLCNVSKGRLGNDASQLLGSLLVANTELAAMSRAEQPPAERRFAAIYIDEVQNFAGSKTLATAWSEGRKFGASWIVAHQFLDQLDEPTLAAAFGNVGSLVAFRCGQDAERLAEQFGGELMPEDLRSLPKHHAYARLLVDSTPTKPFSMTTIPPRRGDMHRAEIIRRLNCQ